MIFKKSFKSAGRETNYSTSRKRIFFLRAFLMLIAVIIVLRLFGLQVIQSNFYEALASGQHSFFKEFIPERGSILVSELKSEATYPVVANQELAFVYADPTKIEDPKNVAIKLGEILELDFMRVRSTNENGEEFESPSEVELLEERLSKEDDPYEPIMRRVSDEKLENIESFDFKGIYNVREPTRMYPERGLGGHIFGFIGSDEEGKLSGRYGIEGSFDSELAGIRGYLFGERDTVGRIIGVGKRDFVSAIDGSDIVLTIDRNIQFVVCEKVREAVLKHGADSGSAVVLDPFSGAVIAMCAYPDYDPEKYNEVESIDIYRNPVIFGAYEPGSVFKPVTMAAALDAGAVTPATTYNDTGEEKIDKYTIKNSDLKSNGIQTMTEVLEKSLNTGVIFAMRQTTAKVFRDYVRAFGFGEATGIELDAESSGDISSLEKKSEIYPATASFGQGITSTTLQLASAYSAIANGGILYKPYIVSEIRHQSGEVEKTESVEIRRAISEKTSQLLSAMLVSVVEHGHGGQAGVDGYYVAGKTGTAQIPRRDGLGYEQNASIGTFAGFAPQNKPRFVIVARIDRPRDVTWAESTAAPLFGEIASFLLQYLEVPHERKI